MSFCIEKIGFEPEVKGAAILIKPPEFEEVTNGIIKPGSFLRDQEIGTAIGQILSIGNNAFKGSDERSAKHFSTYECKVGDWVEYSIYERQASAFKNRRTNKPLCYYINDEKILAKIKEEDLKFYDPSIKT